MPSIKMRAALGVQFIGKDMIRISYNARSATNMKEILEKISEECVKQILAPALASLENSVHFLEEQAASQKTLVDHTSRQLAEFRNRHANELPEFQSQNMSRVATLKQNLAEKESLLTSAQETLESIGEQLLRNNPLVGHLEEQIVQLRGELAMLSARYTAKHLKVQAVTRQLERIEAERGRLMSGTEEIADIERLLNTPMGHTADDERSTNTLLVAQLEKYQMAKNVADILGREVQRLSRQVAEAEAKSSDSGDLAQRLQELERDLKIQRTLYEDLLGRKGMAKVKLALGIYEQSERIQVIDLPFSPRGATNLPLAVFVIGGVFAGVALGISLATVLELLDSSIRNRRGLEAITQVPMLSRIPPLQSQEGSGTPRGQPVLKALPTLKRGARA